MLPEADMYQKAPACMGDDRNISTVNEIAQEAYKAISSTLYIQVCNKE